MRALAADPDFRQKGRHLDGTRPREEKARSQGRASGARAQQSGELAQPKDLREQAEAGRDHDRTRIPLLAWQVSSETQTHLVDTLRRGWMISRTVSRRRPIGVQLLRRCPRPGSGCSDATARVGGRGYAQDLKGEWLTRESSCLFLLNFYDVL